MANRDGAVEVFVTESDRFEGLLLGCAVGDSIGLPAEGLSRERIRRRWKGIWKQRLVFGRGLISDDTEHTWMVAECIARCGGDVERFRKLLATKLRTWFVAIPPGIGLATARACVKLCCGVSPTRSGICSAGNGPAMRSAVIGAVLRDSSEQIESFVRASTNITHTDPRAMTGALAVARSAAITFSSEPPGSPPSRVLNTLRECGTDEEWLQTVQFIERALATNASVDTFAEAIGCERGVSGYVYHTVPVAIYAWLHHFADFQSAVESVCNCGGDTDTVAAISGSLLGATLGHDAIPLEWRRRLMLWPSSKLRLDALVHSLTNLSDLDNSSFSWPALVAKNLLMIPTVLLHGLRRLVPF